VTAERIPRWSWWALAALGVWLLWGLAVGRPLLRAISELAKEHMNAGAEKTKLESRIAAVPQHVKQLQEARTRLDSLLTGFHSRDDCDALLGEIRRDAQSRGLLDVTADPRLGCLLDSPMGPVMTTRLDTITVDVTARGRFIAMGHWLDAIEARDDFRYWVSCDWHADSDKSEVAFKGRAVLVVVQRAEPVRETDAAG
jgi:hypothetical protein